MINVCHLIWIVPVSALLGMILAAILGDEDDDEGH